MVEFLKTILIVVLLCSLLLLAIMAVPSEAIRNDPVLSGLLAPVAPLLGLPEAELAYVAAAPPMMDAAQPVAISVRNSLGRSTAMWDFRQLDTAYETLGGALGQALDTAENFLIVPREQIRTALSGPGACFLYGGSLPAALPAGWLGAALEADVPAVSGFLLAVERETVQLYLIGDSCYCAGTLLDPAELTGLLEDFRPDGSRFAFEDGLPLDDLSLIPGGEPVVRGGTFRNPLTTRRINDLATTLGFNPYGDGCYTDDAGTTHFSEYNCTLQIAADGQVLLTAAGQERFRAADDEAPTLAELARRMVSAALEDVTTDGRLYLTGLTRQEEQTVCTFDYYLSGIPVTTGGAAASVTFSGQQLQEMELAVRSFTLTTGQHRLLPVAQAAAVLPRGAALQLQYRMAADGTLEVGWMQSSP